MLQVNVQKESEEMGVPKQQDEQRRIDWSKLFQNVEKILTLILEDRKEREENSKREKERKLQKQKRKEREEEQKRQEREEFKKFLNEERKFREEERKNREEDRKQRKMTNQLLEKLIKAVELNNLSISGIKRKSSSDCGSGSGSSGGVKIENFNNSIQPQNSHMMDHDSYHNDNTRLEQIKGPLNENQLICQPRIPTQSQESEQKSFVCEEKIEIGQEEDMKVNDDEKEGEKMQKN